MIIAKRLWAVVVQQEDSVELTTTLFRTRRQARAHKKTMQGIYGFIKSPKINVTISRAGITPNQGSGVEGAIVIFPEIEY